MDSNVLKLLLAGLIVFVILRMVTQGSSSSMYNTEGYTSMTNTSPTPSPKQIYDTIASAAATQSPSGTPLPNSTGPPLTISTDLLPKANDQLVDFAEYAPKALQGQNFMDASKYVGVNTQGSSMRNANYQLRADVPNPRTNVGPWANSTIDADLLRKPLE